MSTSSTPSAAITLDDIVAMAELTEAPKQRSLSLEHRAYLMAAAIDPALAQAYTANTVEDLPEELRFHTHKHGAGIVPGIVFEHVTIDGRITAQLRPDVKPEDGGKYLFPKGASTGPFIHRSQAHLVGKLDKVVIVEGTKQFRTAVSIATADGSIAETFFVGLPGCHGGVSNHQHSPDWNEIIRSKEGDKDKGVDTVIMFDADTAENINVWKAADKLRKHLLATSGGKVRVAEIPAYGKDGLDDYLGKAPEGHRSNMLQGILREAENKMPRRPSAAMAKRSAGAFEPTVNFAAGTIGMPDDEIAGTKVKGRILMPAAVRIAKSYYTFNDLDPELAPVMTYDLEICTKITGTLRTHLIRNIDEATLQNPRLWINRIPGGAGANITYDTKDAEKIVNAIRSCSTQEMIQRVERTGLIVDADGVVRFMDVEGALGPDDKILDLQAKIAEEKMKGLVFPNPHDLTDDEKREAFRHVLDMWDILVDPSAFLLVLGASTCAIYGLEPAGTFGSFGETGSGKTTVLEMNLGMFPKARKANFEDSKGIIGRLGAGLENMLIGVDDFQDLSASSSLTTQTEKIEALNKLLRRGYGGSDYSRSRLMKNNSTGRFDTDAADPASPFFAVTMELNAIPYGMKSSMERLLLAEVTRANSFATSEDAHRAMAMAKDTKGARALAVVIAELLKAIEAEGRGQGLEGQASLTHWKQTITEYRQAKQKELEVTHPGLADPRSYEVAATPALGVEEFLMIAKQVGALEPGEFEARSTQSADAIMAASFAWEAQVLNRARGTEDHLGRLSNAVTAGTHVLAADWREASKLKEDARVRILGWRATYAGQEVIVTVPSEAARILGKSHDIAGVQQRLKEHLVTDSKGNPKVAMTTGVGGKKDRLWCIKASAWDIASSNLDANVEAPIDETF